MASLQAWNVNLTGCVDRALSPVTRAKPYLAALGAVYLSFKTGQAAYCLGRGLVSYFLTQPLQLAIDLRKIGEWAVVTGASDGIGKEYAHHLAAKGLNIVLIARNAEKTENVAREIRANHGVLTKVIILDLSQIKPEDVTHLQDHFRPLKIATLINNAGVFYDIERFLDCPPTSEKAADLVTVNITALVLITRAVLPLLLAQGKGHIVNISSDLGKKPSVGAALYGASKTFVDYFSKALDCEYKSHGIRVQCVLAGPVRTSLLPSEYHKSIFAVDTPDFVRSAISLIGVRQRHHGHWRHALMSHLVDPQDIHDILPKP